MHRQCERLPFGLFCALRPFVFCDDGLRALFDLRKDAVEDAFEICQLRLRGDI